jgi:hypothetical protein
MMSNALCMWISKKYEIKKLGWWHICVIYQYYMKLIGMEGGIGLNEMRNGVKIA